METYDHESENTELTVQDMQELLFVYEYLRTWDGIAAAKVAGVGSWREMLDRPNVQKRIAEARTERVKAMKINADMVLYELLQLYNTSFAEIIDVDEEGNPRFDFTRASHRLLSTIEKVKIKPGEFGTEVEVSLPSKQGILRDIGKHVNVRAFEKDGAQFGDVTIIIDNEDSNA